LEQEEYKNFPERTKSESARKANIKTKTGNRKKPKKRGRPPSIVWAGASFPQH
jgi:hypothetical protein